MEIFVSRIGGPVVNKCRDWLRGWMGERLDSAWSGRIGLTWPGLKDQGLVPVAWSGNTCIGTGYRMLVLLVMLFWPKASQV